MKTLVTPIICNHYEVKTLSVEDQQKILDAFNSSVGITEVKERK